MVMRSMGYFENVQPNHTEMVITGMLDSQYVIFKVCSESWKHRFTEQHMTYP